ncbi:trichohyalin isoform X2 [Clinocottus analis]|uniref:trichohyalin isoform X2 n=1 Tax=Clinocottus analis TaxID=304258 RepID=UPI0035BF3207
MGTKRPSWSLFDTLSNINISNSKLQPGGKTSRDPSPRPAMTAQSERERDSKREEDRRSERETEKKREKARNKDMDPRDRYYERDRAPAARPREGEREWRERERRQRDDRSRNGLSHLEKETVREVERATKKGGTFPRTRKRSADRGKEKSSTAKEDEERRDRRQRDGLKRVELDDWERERERAHQRERYRERERDDMRSWGKEEGKNTVEDEKSRKGKRYLESDVVLQDRMRERGDSRDRRERDAGRKREKSRPNIGQREARVPSPRNPRDIYPDQKDKEMTQSRVGRRDTRSEGDSDERERKRERGRYKERQELTYQHSRSEGDDTGKTLREKDPGGQLYREGDRPRYRDGDREVDVSRRKGGEKDGVRYRDVDRQAVREGDRLKENVTDSKYHRREEDRYRQYEQRTGRKEKERAVDLRWDDKTEGSLSQNETAPRAPPRVQSSGEWSSDMDGEMSSRRGRDSHEERVSERESTAESDREVEEQRNKAAQSQRETKRSERQERERGEMTEQRRMWLEPQRGKNSKDGFVNRERHARGNERRSEQERSMESQAEWEREGRRVKEEPDEKYLDQSSYRTRQEGRNEHRGDIEKETKGVSVDGEEVDEVWREVDKGGREHLSDSDEWIEGNWLRDAEGESMTDDTEDSDEEEKGENSYLGCSENKGGCETGGRQERETMLSGEEAFVTLSSGGDDEEEFEDCPEFLEPVAAKRCEGDEERGKEQAVNEEDREKQPKYVFCVIGQTSLSQGDSMGGVGRDNSNTESSDHCSDEAPQQPHRDPSRNYEHPIVNIQDTESKSECDTEERPAAGESAEEDVRHRAPSVGMRSKVENPHAEIGTIKRDSQTEQVLTQWREKNRDGEREQATPVLRNPYEDVCSQVNLEQIQPIMEAINTGAMSPEEVEAIRIRMSGAWSMSEEPKRHSQAPHLKWAKDVVREILGRSEENAVDEPNAEGRRNQEVDQCKTEIEDDKQEEDAQLTGEVPVVKLTMHKTHSELEEEEPLEVEGLRDDDEDDKSKSWGEVELRNVLDTIDRRKRNSRFFNAAQLYQQYSEAAQDFEILRQARSDGISVNEDPAPSPAPSPPPACRPLPPLPEFPHPHSLSHTGSITSIKSLPLPEPPKSEGRPSSPRLSISFTQSSTLWRELPGVRNSTELEELTEDERRLQEVRFEVVTSEASYCRSLDIVVEHFVKSKQLGALLTTQDRNWLFSRLADVRAISHSFLSKLEERVETDIINFTVCDIIARHCQRFKMVYVPYLTNQSYQDATFQRLMNENAGFRRIVEKLERSPVCQRLPLRSFLVLPFQRITRIKLLVQNIVKRTTPGTTEATQAIKSLKLLEKLIQESNDSITQMKSIESLVFLSAKVDFECRTLPLISQSRRLVREGPVTELMDFSLKETERNVYLHLFNDYLLLSLQKEGGRFTVIDHCPVSDLRAENCRVKLHSLQKNLFRLHMTNRTLLLRNETQSDKLRWISAVSWPHPEIDFSAAQDFKQMQCIRAIVSQQPDELSLEKADIILVHQQSSDHWVEGTRLSDRHRGWVPQSHLETITNSRVRQRNLEDALKLTTATAAV